MSKSQIERDCTDKCKSIEHGNNISAVITKRCVTDAELCAYIRWRCSCCGQVQDAMGRTAVHFAASCGRANLLKWLLAHRHAQINAKDYESGYTALHRSVFYGQIHAAVALIHLGASIHLLDNNDLSPLDHASKDRLRYADFAATSLCQAYVWGTNTNDTLGTGHQHAKQLPDLHEAFHKKYKDASVRQICMSKFHTVIVTRDGRVFSCGHGQGGRLGLQAENTVLIPEQIHLNQANAGAPPPQFVQASVGLDHSIFLSDAGGVWTCGLNTHHVLGVKPPPGQLLQPRPVLRLSEMRGVCAGRFHSVAWCPSGVYTWGLHAGQLGHDKSPQSTYVTPKIVSNILSKETEIVSVAASDGATVVATKKGDVYVFHEYQIRKIATKQINVDKVVVVGGHLNSKLSNDVLVEKGGNELRVLVLQTTGNLYLWQESWPQLSRCIYSLNRPLIITDAALSRTQLFFATVDGEAFRGEFKTRKKKAPAATTKTAFHEFLDKDECQMIKVHRYPHIHRAVKIHCDLKGRNFAVIQCAPQCLLVDVPEVSRKTMPQDMRNLLENSDEMDAIHDACFKVSGHIFPVHRYIIAMKSEQLDGLIESNAIESNVIELTNIHPIIFKQILMYIYTGTCDILRCGACTQEMRDLTNKETKFKDKNPVGLLQQAAKRFGIKSLYKQLDGYTYTYDGTTGYVQLKNKALKTNEDGKFDRRMFKNLHDVLIQSKGGTEMYAHKCVLAARLEYFNNLFALRWNEITDTNITRVTLPITHNEMETVVEFLYTDEAKDLTGSDDVDHISNVLVVSDQLFIERLKEICEVALSALLTLKNAAHMLQFASVYNATQLKRCTMEFICLNLAAVLETKILEILEEEILSDLTHFYCNWNRVLCSRVITPFSDAPSDETVKHISEMYPVNDVVEEEVKRKTSPKSQNTKKRTRTRSKTTSISETNTLDETTPRINTTNNEVAQSKHTDDKWVQILTEKQKHQKIVQNRLRAIANAKEEVTAEKVSYNLIKLIEPSTSSTTTTNKYEYDIPIQKRISQGQRKKLNTVKNEEELNSPPKCSPWQKIETPSPMPSSPLVQPNFSDIISDERKQKENWSKMRARPLIYSQMEDKAISDLERFYNIEQVSDECITIHKVVKDVFAAPLWAHNKVQ